MSEKDNELGEQQDHENQQRDISRRQFLNYVIMGTGGFLAGMPLVPMLRFAIDPALQKADKEGMVAVGKASQFSSKMKRVDFKRHLVDGWYETEESLTAYVYKKEDGTIMAMSPICTHLGCTVQWQGDPGRPNEFHCPCHQGRYHKNGVNIPGTPPTAPLALYEYKIEDGKLYLGQPVPRTGKGA